MSEPIDLVAARSALYGVAFHHAVHSLIAEGAARVPPILYDADADDRILSTHGREAANLIVDLFDKAHPRRPSGLERDWRLRAARK